MTITSFDFLEDGSVTIHVEGLLSGLSLTVQVRSKSEFDNALRVMVAIVDRWERVYVHEG